MNLHQLKFIRETVRQEFNLTEAARALFTSQPGISKAIIEFEDELGIRIFERHGKRIRGLTPPGVEVLKIVERIMRDIDSLKKVGLDFARHMEGNLTIACTHTQARYTLPRFIPAFKQQYPEVHLCLMQGNPAQLAAMVLSGQADLAVATEALAATKGLATVACYTWEHVVIVPHHHPLLEYSELSLADLVKYPIITYDRAFAGRASIDHAFIKANLKPDIVLEAIDADVIKTYVEVGMGIGIIAGVAFDAQRDTLLKAISTRGMFGVHTVRVAVRAGAFLRHYVYRFIEMLAPHLTQIQIRDAIEALDDA